MLTSFRPKFFFALALLSGSIPASAQIFCEPNGNVIIYSNYDGGYMTINIDQNIPNIKIGITTYENCEITITGTYVGNVTEVIYAGFQGLNNHCNPNPPISSVIGVNSNIVSVLQYPPVTWNNSAGWNYGIICNYSCDSVYNQGGCNTPDQIVHYYLTQFGGSLYYHYTQYGCWLGTYNASSGGNCCIGANIIPPQFSLVADFTAIPDTICVESGVFFSNNSFNSYPGDTYYEWDFGDGTPTDTTTNASHGYTAPGSYLVTLTVTDSSGMVTDTETAVITVLDCGPTSITGVNSVELFTIKPNPVHDELAISLPQSLILPATLELIDGVGLVHWRKTIDTNRDILVNVMEIPKGGYLLRITGSNFSGQRKILIQ